MKQTLFQRQAALWVGLAVVTAAALLYLLTLDNGLRADELTGGDLITHQYAQVQGRPSNAPGYPLYTMGGWLWYRLSWLLLRRAFNPIQLLSMYSLLWGTASLALLYLVLLQTSRGWIPVAALLTAFHAATYFFWYYSVTTEQYTSAVFQTLLLVWLAFRWDDRPRTGLLLWMALVSGTMLANMLTTLFILPPLLWFILSRPDPDRPAARVYRRYLRQPALIFKAAGLALLPAASYAYVYLRGAQHPEWRGQGEWDSAWQWFIHFLTIPQGRDELAPGLSLHPFFTAEFPALVWHELTPIIALGGLVGLAFLTRRRAVFLYATLAIYALFCWAYRFGNWFQVIIPAYPLFTIGFAAGLTRLRPFLRRWRGGLPVLYLLLAGLAAYRFAASLPRANQHNRPDDLGLVPAWEILADAPRQPAHLLAAFDEWTALQYVQIVWRLAPGLTVDPVGTPLNRPPRYVTRLAAAAVPDLLQRADIHPQAAGVRLVELAPRPLDSLPPAALPLNLEPAPGLKLTGWEQVDPQMPAPLPPDYPRWQVALYWQAVRPLTATYTISVRPLVNGQPVQVNGEPLIQDHQPVWGLYPTDRWPAGEIVRDVYALSLPAGIKPTSFQVVVYTADASGFHNVGVVEVAR
ncbi:MAG: DUF2723 domain-containing protein [Chloroflexi bacterium]|nr:MAG: DUF2723 domain-containing protein [Chloroflexota bacterium]